MDLASIDTSAVANEGVALELRDPQGGGLLQDDGSPVTITLQGADSDTYVRASNQLTNRALRNRGRATITAESALTDQIGLLAKVTMGWSGIGLGEDNTPFSEDAAKRLYREHAFVREQVQEFISDRGNFSKASPKT